MFDDPEEKIGEEDLVDLSIKDGADDADVAEEDDLAEADDPLHKAFALDGSTEDTEEDDRDPAFEKYFYGEAEMF